MDIKTHAYISKKGNVPLALVKLPELVMRSGS
jgi:hypothetical protein